MVDTEIFLSLAEIAGIFVGFGALIAVRSGTTASAIEVASIGMVVLFAVVVVAVALAPVVISRFGVTGHGLWLASSVIALLGGIGTTVLWERIPGEVQEFMAARAPLKTRAKVELAGLALWGPAIAALVLVVLGVLPDQEAALYFAALVLFLLANAGMLLLVVFRVGLPRVPERGVEGAPGAPTTRA